jgi:hypothetical protein
MTKPAKHIPRWLTIDLMILVIGAVIMIVSALWLESNIHHTMAPPSRTSSSLVTWRVS